MEMGIIYPYFKKTTFENIYNNYIIIDPVARCKIKPQQAATIPKTSQLLSTVASTPLSRSAQDVIIFFIERY